MKAFILPEHHPARIPLPKICSVVEARFGLPPGTLKRNHTKERHISQPRQIAIYLIRERTFASFKDIARHFQMDHSTLIYAHAKVRAARAEQPALDSFLRDLHAEIDALGFAHCKPADPEIFDLPERPSLRQIAAERRTA